MNSHLSKTQVARLLAVVLWMSSLLLQACSQEPGGSSDKVASPTPRSAWVSTPAPSASAKAGYWEGDPGVAFEVTASGQVQEFRIMVPFTEIKTCPVESSDPIAISASGAFSTTVTAPLGQGGQEVATHTLSGAFDDPTHAAGNYSVSWCGDYLQAPASKGEWRAEWKSESPPTPPTTATAPIPLTGVDQPLTVEGLSLQLISARLAEEIPLGASPRTAANPQSDQLLRVDARVLEGDPQAAVKLGEAGKVWLTDEKGSRLNASASVYNAVQGETQTVTWLFDVPKTSQTFTLHLPGDTQIDLTPLIEGRTVPIPTEAGSESLTLTIEPPAAKIQPVFEDYFTDNSNFWVGLYKHEKVDVKDGRMKVIGVPGNYTVLGYCSGDCGPYQQRYFVQADLSREKQTANGFGLAFGINKGDFFYYLFVIYPQDGTFALLKQIDGQWETLVDWTDSSNIKPDPQPNTLAAYFDAGQITLYINDYKVAEYLDPSPIDPGRVGAYADNGFMGLLVENFKVYAENPLETGP
jgi:hypothetical protein